MTQRSKIRTKRAATRPSIGGRITVFNVSYHRFIFLLRNAICLTLSVSLLVTCGDATLIAAPCFRGIAPAPFFTLQAIVQPLVSQQGTDQQAVRSHTHRLSLGGISLKYLGWSALAGGGSVGLYKLGHALWYSLSGLASQKVTIAQTTVTPLAGALKALPFSQFLPGTQSGGSYWSWSEKLLGSGKYWQQVRAWNGGRILHPGDVPNIPFSIDPTGLPPANPILSAPVYQHPILHEMFNYLHDPLTWIYLIAGTILVSGIAYWIVKRWRISTKPTIEEALSWDQRFREAERSEDRAMIWNGVRAFFRPLSVVAGVAALLIAAFVSQQTSAFAQAIGWKQLAHDTVSQTARQQELAHSASELETVANGHSFPVTLGGLIAPEKPKLLFAGPTLNVTVPFILRGNPFAAYENDHKDREKEKSRLADLKEQQARIEGLTSAAAAYSEQFLLIRTLNAALSDAALPEAELPAVEAELAIAKAAKEVKLAALKKTAALPREKLPDDASFAAMTLDDIQDMLEKGLKDNDEPSAEIVMQTLDAKDAAQRVAARGRVRAPDYYLRMKANMVVGFNMGLWDFPMQWILGNGALAVPNYGPKDLDKQSDALKESREKLAAWEKDTRQKLSQALADRRASLEKPAAEEELSVIETAKRNARIERDGLLAVAHLLLLGLDEDGVTALDGKPLEEQNALAASIVLDPVLEKATDALDRWDAALCVEVAKVKPKKPKKHVRAPVVTFTNGSLYLGFTNKASRAWNGAPEFEAETGTGGAGVVMNWMVGAPAMDALQGLIDGSKRVVAGLEKSGEHSPTLWAYKLAIVVGEAEKAERTRAPIPLSLSGQHSPNVAFPFASIGMKDLVWKPVAKKTAKIVSKIVRRGRVPKKVEESADQAFSAYELALAQELWSLRQAALYGTDQDRATYAAWSAFFSEAPQNETQAKFKTCLGKVWNVFDQVTARADFDVLIAQAANREAQDETVSAKEGLVWNPADPFWSFYRDTTNPDSPIGLPLYGINTSLTNNPKAKADKRKKVDEHKLKAKQALADERRKAGLHRAAYVPMIAAFKGQAAALRALAQQAPFEKGPMRSQLEKFAKGCEKKAAEIALREGLDPASILPLDVTQLSGEVAVPDRPRLILSLKALAEEPENAGARRWIYGWLADMPLTVNVFTQNLSRMWRLPAQQRGITAVFGPWDPMNLPVLNRARKADASAAEAAKQESKAFDGAIKERELAYQIEMMQAQSRDYGTAAQKTWIAYQKTRVALETMAQTTAAGAPAPNPAGLESLMKSLADDLGRHAGALAARASGQLALAVLLGALPREKLDELGIRTEEAKVLPTMQGPAPVSAPIEVVESDEKMKEPIPAPDGRESVTEDPAIAYPRSVRLISGRPLPPQSRTQRLADQKRRRLEKEQDRQELKHQQRMAEQKRQEELTRLRELERQQRFVNKELERINTTLSWMYGGLGILAAFIIGLGLVLRRRGHGGMNSPALVGFAVAGLFMQGWFGTGTMLISLTLLAFNVFPPRRRGSSNNIPPGGTPVGCLEGSA